jgi:hypothetical protein
MKHGFAADFEEDFARKPLRIEPGGNDRNYFVVAFDAHFLFSGNGSPYYPTRMPASPWIICHFPFAISHFPSEGNGSNGKWQMVNSKYFQLPTNHCQLSTPLCYFFPSGVTLWE